MHEVIDFGEEALAGAFLKRSQVAQERLYPLRLLFCEDCALVQLADKVSPELMFRDYYYHSSATATGRGHFERYAQDMRLRFKPRSVLEIGCNDGVMLKHFEGVERVVGVDPSTTVRNIEGAEIVNDFFSAKLGMRGFDLIVANNVFAHVEDIHGLTAAVKDALAPAGVFVIEVHHLLRMVEELQYDWIYHEHLFYYSLIALERLFRRHGMRVFDVEPQKMHGGSIRVFVCKDARQASSSVAAMRGLERISGLDDPQTFDNFAWAVKDHGRELRAVLRKQTTAGRVVAGYGASGRANALIQHCKLAHEYLLCMYDDSPARVGYFTPGAHLYVNSGDDLYNLNSSVPDDIVLFAWTYEREIGRKRAHFRGNFIVPLPELRMQRFHVSRGVEMVL